MTPSSTTRRATPPPRRVAVVGGGMVGLATAWFLQERGVEVTIFDRDQVASGASWGSAGWLTPALAAPLPEPAVLRYGVRAVLRPSSPVYVPMKPDPALWRFLAGFARHCTGRRWTRAMDSYGPMNELALAAFETLAAGGLPPPRAADPFLACFRSASESASLVAELEQMRRSGHRVAYDVLTGAEARVAEPALSGEIGAAVRLHDQSFIDPPHFLAALAGAVLGRGAKVHEGVSITQVRDDGPSVVLKDSSGVQHRHHAVVLATGAVLGELARDFGVRRLVQAGRGYSFTVAVPDMPGGPLYFPTQRVACTPLTTPEGPRLRIAGMMEFRAPDAPLDPRRIEAIVAAVRPLLPGADLDSRHDEWVGSRPCTTDGLPLIGATSSPRVFAAGGHGMWGMVWGPLTGSLLAEQITTGDIAAPLAPFDPLRP